MNQIDQSIIQSIHGRQILDSRGIPTVEAEIILKNGIRASAASPSGTSGYSFENCELRDHITDYHGQSVISAVNHINTPIHEALKGETCTEQWTIDHKLMLLDGTTNKSKLGANTMLAVSLACAKAASKFYQMELFRFLGGISTNTIPAPLLSLVGGGICAKNQMELEEILMLPVAATKFTDAIKISTDVYFELGRIFKQNGISSAVGIHGEYLPDKGDDADILSMITKAIQNAGYQPNYDVRLSLRAKPSEWYKNGHYIFPKQQKKITQGELIQFWTELTNRLPIASLIDPLSENDFSGYSQLTSEIGHSVQIVGGDILSSKLDRIQQSISSSSINAILIKPSQAGTLTEIIEIVNEAKKNGIQIIFSHFDGEIGDSFLSDLAVAVGANQLRAGAPAGYEHVGKYNRLLKIESMISGSSLIF